MSEAAPVCLARCSAAYGSEAVINIENRKKRVVVTGTLKRAKWLTVEKGKSHTCVCSAIAFECNRLFGRRRIKKFSRFKSLSRVVVAFSY